MGGLADSADNHLEAGQFALGELGGVLNASAQDCSLVGFRDNCRRRQKERLGFPRCRFVRARHLANRDFNNHLIVFRCGYGLGVLPSALTAQGKLLTECKSAATSASEVLPASAL